MLQYKNSKDITLEQKKVAVNDNNFNNKNNTRTNKKFIKLRKQK